MKIMEISLPENPNHYHIIVGIICMISALVFGYYISIFYFWFFAIVGFILYLIGLIGLQKNYELQKEMTIKQKELLEEEIAIKRLEKEKLIKELRIKSKV